MAKILIVDDEPRIRELIREHLEHEGFQCEEATDGSAALAALASSGADLVILDIMMPFVDGMSCLREMRKRKIDTPVIMLTARGEEYDKLAGLEGGADDYVTKPFSFAVLVARLRALIRRGVVERPVQLEAGDLRLDPATHQVWRGEALIDLTAREFSVLEYLMRRVGQVLTKQQLLEGVWDQAFDGDPNIVEVYIGHLRRKVDRPFGRAAIETLRGAGYRLAVNGG